MAVEPILWAHLAEKMRRIPAKRHNPDTGEIEQLFDDETGEPLYEKIPQRGHIGEKYPTANPPKRPFFGWHLLKHCGNEVRIMFTNAAAQLDPDTKHHRERQAKARFFGWIPVGRCPVFLCMTQELKVSQLADKEMAAAIKADKIKPCPRGVGTEKVPCEHYYAERAARRARKAKVQGKRDKAFAPDVQKQIEAQREQTTQIGVEVGKAVAAAMATAADTKKK